MPKQNAKEIAVDENRLPLKVRRLRHHGNIDGGIAMPSDDDPIPLKRVLRRTGIKVLGIDYRSSDLAELLDIRQKVVLDVRVDDRDISTISYQDPRDGSWHDATASVEGLENVALSEWIETVRYVESVWERRPTFSGGPPMSTE